METINYNSLLRLLSICILGTLLISGCYIMQAPNPYYKPSLTNPAYDVPLILVDATHSNFHQITGRYMPFASLARADGYRVEELTTSFQADCYNTLITGDCEYWNELLKADVFVLPHLKNPLSDDEADMLARWVYMYGGSLLIIADHVPYGSNVLPLLIKLNMNIDPSNSTTSMIQDKSLGQWDNSHPIITGRSSPESVNSLQEFGIIGIRLDSQSPFTGPNTPNPKILVSLENNDAFATTLEWGQGRVVVVGDGSVLTDQIWLTFIEPFVTSEQVYDICEKQGQLIEEPISSSNECYRKVIETLVCGSTGVTCQDSLQEVTGGLKAANNQQFVLNILHWLSRIF